jgi:hypothetical protein
LKLKASVLTDALTDKEGFDIVMKMQPWRYTLKEGLPTYQPGEEIGMFAEVAEKTEPRLVAMNKDGTAAGFRYEQYTAALTAAFKYLKADNDNLRSEVEGMKRANAR